MNNSPLVSVCVITYNSSKYVLETLESIKEQTYRNIELIISDDCSSDSTLELCNSWLREHSEKFKRTELITVEKNTGISANCNRVVDVAQGEWIKVIAGDDLLVNTCIEDFIDFATKNENVMAVISKTQSFEIINGKKVIIDVNPTNSQINIFSMTAKGQLIELLSNPVSMFCAPAFFYKRNILQTIKYDERYRDMEDYPFFVHLTMENIKIYFMDKIGVLYRHSESSICQSNFRVFYPAQMLKPLILFSYNEKRELIKHYVPYMLKNEKRFYLLWLMTDFFLHNRVNWRSKIVYKIFHYIIYRFF